MSYLSPALQREVDAVTRDDQESVLHDGSPEAIARVEAKVRAQLLFAGQANDVALQLATLAMGRHTKRYLTVALSTEHRTILGQIMAAVSAAVIATTEDIAVRGYCPGDTGEAGNGIIHARHDERLTCATVIGATLAQHQPII